MNDIVIIGAGITGLSVARALRKRGKSVIILEARNRAGGRIHTFSNGFSTPVEGGAEFIHGKAPLTHSLMKECGVTSFHGAIKPWEIRDGKAHRESLFSGNWNEFENALQNLREDMTMSQFMHLHFPGNNQLESDVKRMVQGFDAADMNRISVFSIREEWASENEIPGSRLIGGYSQLIKFLLKELNDLGAEFQFNSIVSSVNWERGYVRVTTADGKDFEGAQVLITVPLGVLKAGTIQFTPALPEHEAAFNRMEMGGVIKFLVEVRESFWETKGAHHTLQNLAFLFSDAPVPTWWTQKPDSFPLLTGWLAGPPAREAEKDQHKLLQSAADSLSYIFQCSEEFLTKQIVTSSIINWENDPFARGAYAYATVHSQDALKTITKPVDNTVFFAGEAFHEGEEMGTVEAALGSASNVTEKIG